MPRNKQRRQMGKNAKKFDHTVAESGCASDNVQVTNASENAKDAFRHQNYKSTLKENAMFEKYYQEQGLIKVDDWQSFMISLREPLPTTFRITGSRRQAQELMKVIKSDFFSKLANVEELNVEAPFQLPWYPDGLAWQLNIGRKDIRHFDALVKLKQFLYSETESGNMSRQEAVSMIPPLVLDVKPHHKVLDMCAAPGSKTAQLIELLQPDAGVVPQGFVLANDSDNKRCYLMCHQIQRLESANFAIINHDAQFFPGMKISTEDGPKPLRFDRILADVPCTGDGTLRKNVDVWGKWNSAAGHCLHKVQYRILKRGLELLELGGRLVYSTCSFNPVENEAVIAAVLRSGFKSVVRLVDASDRLPGLKYIPGLSTWKIMERNGEFFTTYDDVPERLQSQIQQSTFPPTEEEALEFNLHRCIRVLPHLQNTGAFFIAVFEKYDDKKVPNVVAKQAPDQENKEEMDEAVDLAPIETADPTSGNRFQKRHLHPDNPRPLKKQKLSGFKEDPFIFLNEEHDVWKQISGFYDLKNFPAQQLMIRGSEGRKRNLYYVAQPVRDIILLNQEYVKFINLGVKVMNRSPTKYCSCDYRLVQDGAVLMTQYLSSRTVVVGASDLILLLSCENPFTNRFSNSVQKQVKSLVQGSVIFTYNPVQGEVENSVSPQIHLNVCGWLGVVTMRTFLQRHDREHLLRLFRQEVKPPEKEARANEEDILEQDNCEVVTSETNDDKVSSCVDSLSEQTKTVSSLTLADESTDERQDSSQFM